MKTKLTENLANRIYRANSETERAYNKDTRNLSFCSTVEIPLNDAIVILEKHVPSYNEFEPKLLKNLPADSKIRIAREFSVCLYVTTTGKLNQTALKADKLDLHYVNEAGIPVWRLWWD